MGNRVSTIIDLIPPDRWNHVAGTENPADYTSRGIFPSELLQHGLWWNGHPWLRLPSSYWPEQHSTVVELPSEEERGVCLATTTEQPKQPIVPINHYLTLSWLQHVTAWIIHFLINCRPSSHRKTLICALSVAELKDAEQYCVQCLKRLA